MLLLCVNPPPVASHCPENPIGAPAQSHEATVVGCSHPIDVLLPYHCATASQASVVCPVGHHSPPCGLCSSSSLGRVCPAPSFAVN